MRMPQVSARTLLAFLWGQGACTHAHAHGRAQVHERMPKELHMLHGRRQQRIKELQQAKLRPRFGTVEEIRGSEFVQQVCSLS